MPIKGARYRWKTLKSGKKIRLAFVNNRVVEVKKKGGKAKRVNRKKKKHSSSSSRGATYGGYGKIQFG